MAKSDTFLLPQKVAELMKGFAEPWFVAGGWALDLYLNRVTREHKDVEIAIFRRDQGVLHEHLKGWAFKKVKDGRLESWSADERLELPIHEIYAFNPNAEPRELEILLNERDDSNWIFRRNPIIKRELSLVSMRTEDGVPYLSPEIVFLYKANNPTPRDEQDFRNVVGELKPEPRFWLREALTIYHPDHHWLDDLASG